MPDKPLIETAELVVEGLDTSQRIDAYLAQLYPEQSRHYFQGLIQAEDVLLNDRPTIKRERVVNGDQIRVAFRAEENIDLTPQDIPLDILFEDPDIIAVNKPAGMTVHPAPGNWSGTFVNALLYHCNGLELEINNLRPGIVHRLDKHTSGVLIAAKTKRAHLRLGALFAERRMHKEYQAICLGNAGEGVIENYLDRHPVDRKKRTVVQSGGKIATTRYKTVAERDKLCLVQLLPKTGRTHQLRVHMQFHGTPILGDPVYGNAQANKRWDVHRQLLHASRLVFAHPFTGEPMEIRAEAPEDMTQLCAKMRSL
jgi:23S rRNA pseudouridine1911/1915/1917 synthase